jgi:hypothetical protein
VGTTAVVGAAPTGGADAQASDHLPLTLLVTVGM